MNWDCLRCGIDTNKEYYMIHDYLWRIVNPGYCGLLCIGCVEEALGRTLTRKDFTDVPINDVNYLPSVFDKSERLINRLTNG